MRLRIKPRKAKRRGDTNSEANYLQKGMDTYEIPQYSSLSICFGSLKDVCLYSNLTGSFLFDRV